MALLEVDNIVTSYGNIKALKGVSLTVDEGEIVTLIGSNGAGKTTTLRSITGTRKPSQGAIRFNGADITRMRPDKIVGLGISMSPEGRRIFPRMTVTENLEMGAFQRKDRAGIKADMEHVFELFPRLRERAKQKGGTMSGGEQQMLAIGRAMMAKPRVLLLDEPSMGLAPILVDKIFEIVQEINQQGTTVLLVEQNANVALGISDRGYVLETGKVAIENEAKALLADDRVRAAYLGE
jgi:branched-chain amino acid transport system ATP-binding protein